MKIQADSGQAEAELLFGVLVLGGLVCLIAGIVEREPELLWGTLLLWALPAICILSQIATQGEKSIQSDRDTIKVDLDKEVACYSGRRNSLTRKQFYEACKQLQMSRLPRDIQQKMRDRLAGMIKPKQT